MIARDDRDSPAKGIGLKFLNNDGGESEGLGDAGIETFKDHPYASCGREAGQNAGDAAEERPVLLTFDALDIPINEIPAHEDLLEAVQCCLSEATQEKERDFFLQAEKLLTNDTVKVLRIADYKTKGLQGPPDQPRTPFHSLVKSAGVSNDKSDTSGGSFGIGKNASFAVSDLQTVFYSTIYEPEPGKSAFAAQGKARLVSHTGKDGAPRRSFGYWGKTDGCRAVTRINEVPEWLRRSERGTSIFSLGFRMEDDWAEHIAYSLLSNFFAAVEQGDMEFEIDGRIRINANTIAGLFKDAKLIAAAEKSNRTSEFEFAAQLHRCLTSGSTITTDLSVEGMGSVTLKVLVEDGLPKKLGIARNGMLITTGLKDFGDKFERFPGAKDFIALVTPSPDASRLMKTLENPKHDNFSAERINDPKKRRDAERAMRALRQALRSGIREATAVATDEEVSIDELSSYFAMPPSGHQPPNPKADHDPEKYTYTVPIVRKKRKTDTSSHGSEGGRPTPQHRVDPNTTPNPNPTDATSPGPGHGGEGKQGRSVPTAVRDLRNALSGTEPQTTRKVWFTPTATGVTTIRFESPGLNSAVRLVVASADTGGITAGELVLDLVEGVRKKIEVSFDAPYDGPVEIVASVAVEEVQP